MFLPCLCHPVPENLRGIGGPRAFAGGPIPHLPLLTGVPRPRALAGVCPRGVTAVIKGYLLTWGQGKAVLCQVRPEANRVFCPCVLIPVFRSCLESVTCRGAACARPEQVKGRLPRLPLKRGRFVIALPKTRQQSQVSLFVFAGNVRGMMDLAGKVNNLPG